MEKHVPLGIFGVEVEGGYASGIDGDGEVQEAEAGCAVVLCAVLQLKPDAWVLAVETVPELPSLARVPDQDVAIIHVS